MGALASRRKAKASSQSADFDDVQRAVRQVRLEQHELETLSRLSKFDVRVVEMLQEVFLHISAYEVEDSLIDPREFARALGLDERSLLVRRIFDRFNITRSGDMNFREFISAVSTLSTHGSLDDKIRFSFSIYDFNGDGKIEPSELKSLLLSCLKGHPEVELSSAQIEQICRQTFAEMDLDGNGAIEFEEYAEMVRKNPRLVSPFTIDLRPLLKWADEREKQQHRAKLTKFTDPSVTAAAGASSSAAGSSALSMASSSHPAQARVPSGNSTASSSSGSSHIDTPHLLRRRSPDKRAALMGDSSDEDDEVKTADSGMAKGRALCLPKRTSKQRPRSRSPLPRTPSGSVAPHSSTGQLSSATSPKPTQPASLRATRVMMSGQPEPPEPSPTGVSCIGRASRLRACASGVSTAEQPQGSPTNGATKQTEEVFVVNDLDDLF